MKVTLKDRGIRVTLIPSGRYGTILQARENDGALVILDSGEVINLQQDRFELGNQNYAVPAHAAGYRIQISNLNAEIELLKKPKKKKKRARSK